jgi:hypothetical protein
MPETKYGVSPITQLLSHHRSSPVYGPKRAQDLLTLPITLSVPESVPESVNITLNVAFIEPSLPYKIPRLLYMHVPAHQAELVLRPQLAFGRGQSDKVLCNTLLSSY